MSEEQSAPKSFNGNQEQFQKFMEAARELECDEDEAAFEEKLKKIAKVEPAKSDDDHNS